MSNTDESEFQVPPGCIVEKVAGQPLINYPLFACFDDQGRLYVAEGTGTNLAGTELEKLNLGKITLLEDTDDDGKFDKSTTFADGLVFPQGVLCHDGAVYVASHPAIWRLVDTDGDGRADRREEFIGKFGFNGNGCDIHGPFLGPDGWIYWTDGRHGHKCPTKEGEVLEGFAARIFRCRPDGTGLERICGGGFDNPVELVFTDTGEMIGTMDQGPGDCLLHYVEGGVYPRDDQPCLKEFPMTGPLLQPITSFSAALPAALCGLVRIRSDHFGPEYKNSLLTTQFNVHRLQQHMLVRDGATFRTINKDFLTSTNYDLRLTDVLEDADGSLLMVDMGAWFNYGCPTAKIAKPEVKGSIYRIRRTDAPAVNDPWGRAIRWATLSPAGLAELLDDPRPMVRDRAIEQLRKRGGAAVSAFTAVLGAASGRAAVESIGARSAGGTSTRNPLVGSYASERSPSLTLRVGVSRVTEDRATPTRSVSEGIPLRTVQARRNAIWALSPIGTADARAAIRAALADEDATVRQVAAHCAGLERDAEARSALAKMAAIDEPSLRARAADALGRIGGPDSVPALIEGLRHGASDRFLEHALIYALIRIADREATIVTLKDPNPQVRRAGLIALDQMKGGQLTRDLVVPLLDTDDPQLQQAALDVISRQEGWANEVITLVRDWVNTETLSPDKQASLAGSLLALATDATVQNLMADALVQSKTPQINRQLLLGVVARCRLDQIPPRWAEAIRDLLQGKERTLQREAVAVVRSRNLAAFDPQLIELSRQSDAPADLRIAALECLGPRRGQLEPAAFELLVGHLADGADPLLRVAAARTIGGHRPSNEQLLALGPHVANAGPLIVPLLAPAFSHSSDPKVGQILVDALKESPGTDALSGDELRKLLSRYSPEVQATAQPLLEKLAAREHQQELYLTQLVNRTLGTPGNPERGRQVFFSQKVGCAGCHRLEGKGGNVGPDLSLIGRIRDPRALLEAVVFPSSTIVPEYRSYTIAGKDGTISTGMIVRETADALYLRTSQLAEIRIARHDVDELQPSNVSIMPQGLEKTMTDQEFADLLEFLYQRR